MGHGQVRCGKCRTQFDALDSLLDDPDDSTEEAGKAAAMQDELAQANRDHAEHQAPEEHEEQSPAIEAREPDRSEEITMEGSRIEISGTYRVPAGEMDADSDPSHDQIIREHVVIDRNEQPTEDESRNDDPFITADEEQIVEISTDDGEPVAAAAEHLLDDTQAAAEEHPEPLPQRLWKRARGNFGSHHDRERHAVKQQIAAELDALTETYRPTDPKTKMWAVLTGVLIVFLLAQMVHHSRDQLVRSAKWGPTVSRVYRTLGLTLTPNWDLSAYEVQQWGVISDASARDALRVRASVTNTAPFAQPYPQIKLALEDRWGSAIAMREFAPEEYLQSSATADRMMAPRQRANAEIVIIDPGADAVGFQIHACLTQGKGVVCSDDLPTQK
jgi:hypothetical protein